MNKSKDFFANEITQDNLIVSSLQDEIYSDELEEDEEISFYEEVIDSDDEWVLNSIFSSADSGRLKTK